MNKVLKTGEVEETGGKENWKKKEIWKGIEFQHDWIIAL